MRKVRFAEGVKVKDGTSSGVRDNEYWVREDKNEDDDVLEDTSSDEESADEKCGEKTTRVATTPVLGNARSYLKKYWPKELDAECCFIVGFLHDVFANSDVRSLLDRKKCVEMVDVGGGPVIDKAISASSIPGIRIFHLDPSESAREEINMWLENRKNAYPHWESRFEHVAKLEGGAMTPAAVEARVRSSIVYVGSCDLKRSQFSKPKGFRYSSRDDSPDIVSCHSVLACISKTRKDFMQALDALTSLCGADTLLILTVNVETSEWCVGDDDKFAPAFQISARKVLCALASRGFDEVRICRQHKGSGSVSTEMPSTLAVAATRSNRKDSRRGDEPAISLS
eukprot:g1770.t1